MAGQILKTRNITNYDLILLLDVQFLHNFVGSILLHFQICVLYQLGYM